MTELHDHFCPTVLIYQYLYISILVCMLLLARYNCKCSQILVKFSRHVCSEPRTISVCSHWSTLIYTHSMYFWCSPGFCPGAPTVHHLLHRSLTSPVYTMFININMLTTHSFHIFIPHSFFS